MIDSSLFVLVKVAVYSVSMHNNLLRSQAKQEYALPLHVVERFIELLCRYDPSKVYTFLKSNDNYRLEEALEVSSSPHNETVCGYHILLV